MDAQTFDTGIAAELSDSIVSAARTSLGDTLRSVVYFTREAFDVLYVRADLYDDRAGLREAKSRLVGFERAGLSEEPARSEIARQRPGSNIGRYEFTVRFHEDGFVVRVLHGDAGILLTADSMDVSAFEDAVGAIRRLLDDQ